jgi:signal transduction histidine kinase
MNRPRVLLAEDHRIVAEGLRSLLAADFDLAGVVEDGRALVEAAHRLRFHLRSIEVDGERVKIAFLNLIVNAIEAMEQEKGILTVTTYVKDKKCVVEITDNGHGISAEHMEHLFEPFFTTKGALGAGSGQAAGLGLAIAHGLATMIGAKITVQSELHRGTCFTVTLAPVSPV